MQLTWRNGCKEGPCPNVYENAADPETVIVQGPTVIDPAAVAATGHQLADHESLVAVPKDLIRAYARELLAEEGATV